MLKLKDGYTLMHEHLTIDLMPGDLGGADFDILCRELMELYTFGVRNIVDLTNQGMGRNTDVLRSLASATGINLIPSTGYYLEAYMPPDIRTRPIEDLVEEAVRELTWGIDEEGYMAGVIGEIGWSAPEAGRLECRVWEAMSIAASRTGAVISTHPSIGPEQILQAEFLIKRGIKPERIVIGHAEFFPDEKALLALLSLGVNIGIDMIGQNGQDRDEYRADMIIMLRDRGFLSQVTLSMDLCEQQELRQYGGFGYVHLFKSFLPLLRDRGITEDEIDLLLRRNPMRILG
jgi:phosphotriesterase-related protein